MTLDQLIELLESLRTKHGGQTKVFREDGSGMKEAIYELKTEDAFEIKDNTVIECKAIIIA